ncbi:hypothetical protein F7725_007434 [Dissostichus mawsoni]|uniref:Uncharacterized protein n=1 Tax=Dissostichus mawsoni TaxID=36200 RepID=A0A7J5XWV5_DISMA|nr:hypothetical protein F7725_007434 [Dissostichus mawsoni]
MSDLKTRDLLLNTIKSMEILREKLHQLSERMRNGKSTETRGLVGKDNLLELKAKLKKEREDLDRESEVMNKEKLDFD